LQTSGTELRAAKETQRAKGLLEATENLEMFHKRSFLKQNCCQARSNTWLFHKSVSK
jgi:hypothetical protein